MRPEAWHEMAIFQLDDFHHAVRPNRASSTAPAPAVFHDVVALGPCITWSPCLLSSYQCNACNDILVLPKMVGLCILAARHRVELHQSFIACRVRRLAIAGIDRQVTYIHSSCLDSLCCLSTSSSSQLTSHNGGTEAAGPACSSAMPNFTMQSCWCSIIRHERPRPKRQGLVQGTTIPEHT